jgi:hypothetical protein
MLSQKIEEGDARVFQRDFPPYTIYGEADGDIHAVLRTVVLSNRIAAVTCAARFSGADGRRDTEVSSVFK